MSDEMNNGINQLKLQNYKNSTEIVSGLTMEDVVKACLISKLNIFIVGETGEGKTQLENDILGLFGNKGFFEQGRNDLTVREMFTRLNLEKLRSAKTTEDVKELTEHVRHPVYVVDEMTRCIPAVQNQFFNLFDGFITVDGTKYSLGRDGFSIGIASGNIGNGKYVGTSETDRALRDRMHFIIDGDYFPKTSNDTLDVLAGKKDPRVSNAQPTDKTELMLKLHKQFTAQSQPTLDQYTAALYLVHGLEMWKDNAGVWQSKRKNKNIWPGCVQGHEKGSDAALIFPFSTRSAISALALAQALQYVKKAKNDEYASGIDAVFDAAYLIGAQSGVLHPSAVDSHYNSNPYDAMSAVVDGIRSEFAQKQEVMDKAVLMASKGQLACTDEFTGRWEYMKDILERTAREVKAKK